MNLHLEPITGGYLVIGLVALILVSLLLIGPAYRPVSGMRRGVLTALRMAVVIMVVIAMLRPTVTRTDTQKQSATLIVMVDRSRSMQVPDGGDGRTRWEAQRQALIDALPELRALAEDLEIKIYEFDIEAELLEWDGGELSLAEFADGPQSDIGSALVDVVTREVGQRLAGVVLLTDGAPRAYSPRYEIQEAAQELARQGYPLYTIPFGLPRDKSQARDVAVENLQDSYSVFVKNELLIHGLLRVQGYVNKEVPVEMIVTDSEGNEERFGPLNLVATEDGQQLDIRMTYVPERAGQYKLTLRAAQLPGELVTKNNELTAFLTVREGGLRVLYLYGTLAGEQLRLRWSLNQSVDIQLNTLWIHHGFRDGWPVDLGEYFEEPGYDVYVLESVHADALGEENIGLLAREVENGKGFLMIGGVFSFDPGGYQRTLIADLLPVTMDRLSRQDFDAPLRADLHLQGDVSMIPVEPHFVTQLAPDADNNEFWRQLQPLHGANRFDGVKGSGRVLAASAAGNPLLVEGDYGLGRVLAFAGDSTRRWWNHGEQEAHKRFWRQIVLWLARRDDVGEDDVWVRLPQRRFLPTARVRFTAGVSTARGEDVRDSTLTAALVDASGGRRKLQLTAAGNQMQGTFQASQEPGEYMVEVSVIRDGQPLTARESFVVFDQDLELHDPAANPSLLANMAALTAEFGGRSLPSEEFSDLLRQIRANPPPLEIERQVRWQLADTWQDAWAFLLLFAAVLTGEWFLRKKWGMV